MEEPNFQPPEEAKSGAEEDIGRKHRSLLYAELSPQQFEEFLSNTYYMLHLQSESFCEEHGDMIKVYLRFAKTISVQGFQNFFVETILIEKPDVNLSFWRLPRSKCRLKNKVAELKKMAEENPQLVHRRKVRKNIARGAEKESKREIKKESQAREAAEQLINQNEEEEEGERKSEIEAPKEEEEKEEKKEEDKEEEGGKEEEEGEEKDSEVEEKEYAYEYEEEEIKKEEGNVSFPNLGQSLRRELNFGQKEEEEEGLWLPSESYQQEKRTKKKVLNPKKNKEIRISQSQKTPLKEKIPKTKKKNISERMDSSKFFQEAPKPSNFQTDTACSIYKKSDLYWNKGQTPTPGGEFEPAFKKNR